MHKVGYKKQVYLDFGMEQRSSFVGYYILLKPLRPKLSQSETGALGELW